MMKLLDSLYYLYLYVQPIIHDRHALGPNASHRILLRYGASLPKYVILKKCTALRTAYIYIYMSYANMECLCFVHGGIDIEVLPYVVDRI